MKQGCPGIPEWFGWKGISKPIPLHPCHRQGHLLLNQVAPSPLQPGLGHFLGWGILDVTWYSAKKPLTTPKTDLEQVVLVQGWLAGSAWVPQVGFLQARVSSASTLPFFGGQGSGLADFWGLFPLCSLSLPLIYSFKIIGNGGFFSPRGSMELLLSNLLEAWVEWEWN